MSAFRTKRTPQTADGWRKYAARLREAQRQHTLERLAAELRRVGDLLEAALAGRSGGRTAA